MLPRTTTSSRYLLRHQLFSKKIIPPRPLGPLVNTPRCLANTPNQQGIRHQHNGKSQSRIKLPRHLNTKSNGKRTMVEIDGIPVRFDNVFLRDACPCPECVHPSTQQKLFQTAQVPEDITPANAWMEDGSLKIVWNKLIDEEKENYYQNGTPKPHESVYDEAFLRRYANPKMIIREGFNDWRQVLWDGNTMANDVMWVEYDDYMTSEETLFKMVRHLSSYGLAFLRNVPEGKQQDAVEGVAERIGNLKSTFYGMTWNVKSIKESKNIAYTSLNLGMHMDLLYFESPPGLQFLHCLRNSVTGGASLFADAFHAASYIRDTSEARFEALTKFPVPYHYCNDGFHYHFTRPTVVLEPQSSSYASVRRRISHMSWGPPFQAPFELDQLGTRVSESTHFRQYLVAAKELDRRVRSAANQFELTLKAGDCAVFFNRRILHARRAFDETSGDRWLKGTYVDTDVFRSTYRVLSEKYQAINFKDSEDAFNYLK